MSAAVADRRLAAHPCVGVPLPTETVHEQRFLAVEELDRLVEATRPRYRAMVLLAALGGLRFGELAGLRRRRVSAVPAAVEVVETLVEANGVHHHGPPKTRRSRRTVPLAGEVRDALAAHLDAWTGPDPDALVFTNTNGEPLRRGVFRKAWWVPAIEAAGLGDLRFHDLRHTFVAFWIVAGKDPKWVSVRAGHSSVAFTLDRYGHLYEDQGDEADALDALLASARARSVVRSDYLDASAHGFSPGPWGPRIDSPVRSREDEKRTSGRGAPVLEIGKGP